MKGPFYIKISDNKFVPVTPCQDCMYFVSKDEEQCGVPDCPFYFNDYEEDDEEDNFEIRK